MLSDENNDQFLKKTTSNTLGLLEKKLKEDREELNKLEKNWGSLRHLERVIRRINEDTLNAKDFIYLEDGSLKFFDARISKQLYSALGELEKLKIDISADTLIEKINELESEKTLPDAEELAKYFLLKKLGFAEDQIHPILNKCTGIKTNSLYSRIETLYTWGIPITPANIRWNTQKIIKHIKQKDISHEIPTIFERADNANEWNNYSWMCFW